MLRLFTYLMASLKCNSCKSNNTIEKMFGDYIFHIWNDRFVVSANHKVKLGVSCCEHSKISYVLNDKGKASSVVKQCLSCGYKPNGLFKKSLLEEGYSFFNPVLHASNLKRQEIFEEDINKLLSAYAYKRMCRIKSEWFNEEYNNYLSTNTWRQKRERVLKRDKRTCRACGKNEATQVHHLSYRFVGNEPLYDLASICTRCHNKISKMDENEIKTNFNIE